MSYPFPKENPPKELTPQIVDRVMARISQLKPNSKTADERTSAFLSPVQWDTLRRNAGVATERHRNYIALRASRKIQAIIGGLTKLSRRKA